MSPVSEHVPEFGDKHVTHVEHDNAGWYFWCEADDCYAPRRSEYRYHTTAEVYAVAAEHEANPG